MLYDEKEKKVLRQCHLCVFPPEDHHKEPVECVYNSANDVDVVEFALTYDLSSNKRVCDVITGTVVGFLSREAKFLQIFVFFNIWFVFNDILNSAGNCVTNLTCTCDDKEEEKMKPEKQSALFAKEFQDVLYKTLFTKTEDDNEPPTNKTVLATTAPTTGLNQPNCSNNAQVRSITLYTLTSVCIFS